jgi:hypothetical protein
VSAVLAQANSLEELCAILQDNATTFGFLHIEVCRESAHGSRPLVLSEGHAVRALKLDYPVTPHDFEEGDDHVLRIWSNPRTRGYSFGAERVAQILAPVIEERMILFGAQRNAARAAEELESADRTPVAVHRSAQLVIERGSGG